MNYEEVEVQRILSAETIHKHGKPCTRNSRSQRHRSLNQYEWILVATKKSNVIGVITANNIPKKAIL